MHDINVETANGALSAAQHSAVPASAYRRMRIWFWQHPSLFYPWGLIGYHRNVHAAHFDLWLDGFPRSGNTFAVIAFEAAQVTRVRIRSHTHLAPAIISATNQGLPGMLLVRQPVDAIVSYAIFNSSLPLGRVLNYYTDFHLALLPWLPCLFVASFDEISSDFGRVIRRYNNHFGASYVPFQHTEETVDRINAHIEHDAIQRNGHLDELRVSRPSPQRARYKQQLVDTLFSSHYINELARAQKLYEQFVMTMC